MSLLREIMDESRGVVNDILGHAAILTNIATTETQLVTVVINKKVRLYQDGMFAGLVTTGVFDRTQCDPKIQDTLEDLKTGLEYVLEAVKEETPSKLEFILGER